MALWARSLQLEQVLQDLNRYLKLVVSLWMIGCAKLGLHTKLSLERSTKGRGESRSNKIWRGTPWSLTIWSLYNLTKIDIG